MRASRASLAACVLLLCTASFVAAKPEPVSVACLPGPELRGVVSCLYQYQQQQQLLTQLSSLSPPHPAPVSRAPMAPAARAAATSSSSSGDEHSYRSLQEV